MYSAPDKKKNGCGKQRTEHVAADAYGEGVRRLEQNGTCASNRNRFLLGNSQCIEVILGSAGNYNVYFFNKFVLYKQNDG
jgi:hypothetical protein